MPHDGQSIDRYRAALERKDPDEQLAVLAQLTPRRPRGRLATVLNTWMERALRWRVEREIRRLAKKEGSDEDRPGS